MYLSVQLRLFQDLEHPGSERTGKCAAPAAGRKGQGPTALVFKVILKAQALLSLWQNENTLATNALPLCLAFWLDDHCKDCLGLGLLARGQSKEVGYLCNPHWNQGEVRGWLLCQTQCLIKLLPSTERWLAAQTEPEQQSLLTGPLDPRKPWQTAGLCRSNHTGWGWLIITVLEGVNPRINTVQHFH